ncbi:MAG: hypothetical protein KAU28_03795 [Phycisphaerae bacterium]|nr:hypothetical protein [Phycisphaerae bacterium]
MSDLVKARSSNEFRYYLLVTACEVCGVGPWDLVSVDGQPTPHQPRCAQVTCQHCKADREMKFVSEFEPPDPDSPCISPIDQPSEIIDVDLWLGLAYWLIGQADRESGPESHQHQIRASLCLAEALKFYNEDDELPPAEAFFTDLTTRAFTEHPQSFARQRVRDLAAKLPPPPPWPPAPAAG